MPTQPATGMSAIVPASENDWGTMAPNSVSLLGQGVAPAPTTPGAFTIPKDDWTTSSSKTSGVNGAPILTAFAGLTNAFAQMASGKITSRIDDYNANLARLQAAQAQQAGDLASNQEAGRERQREGATTASFGAQNAVGGTAATTAASIRNTSAMDRMVIETNARRQAMGYENQASTDALKAKLAMTGARTGAASTLLATGAQEELETDPRYAGLRFGANLPQN